MRDIVNKDSIVIPNVRITPPYSPLKRVILHAMGEYVRLGDHAAHAVSFIAAQGLSAHAFVPPHGNTLIETVGWGHVAWHAKGHNQGSYGIEFMVEGLHDLPSLHATLKQPWLRRSAFDAAWKHVGLLMAVVGKELEITTHDRVDPERRPIDPGPMFSFDEFVTKAGKEYESYVTGRQEV